MTIVTGANGATICRYEVVRAEDLRVGHVVIIDNTPGCVTKVAFTGEAFNPFPSDDRHVPGRVEILVSPSDMLYLLKLKEPVTIVRFNGEETIANRKLRESRRAETAGTIQVHARQVMTLYAMQDVAAVLAQHTDQPDRPINELREIEDTTAVTIAAMWQSSGTVGTHLATFASGRRVKRTDVLNDINATRLTCKPAPADSLALDCLATFVINYKAADAV